MRSRVAEEIRARLTMLQVAGSYGFEPNRSGFLRCPFHTGDREASLKLYPDGGGWHCFGCGKGGSVIDFVMELFDLDFRQACVKLNRDFGLGLSLDGSRPSYLEKRKLEEAARRRREVQRAEEEAEATELALILEHRYWWEVRQAFRPESPDYIHPLYEQAVKRLPELEYRIDALADRRWARKRESRAK